jgi:two-component sensor histidine kinase
VRLSWSVVRHAEGQGLEIEWHDTSPPCSDTTGGGFGSRLIRQLVELKRKGTIEIVETPHYACKLSVPLLKGKD